MVRQCQVCKRFDFSSPGTSFHRFPVDPVRRKIWFSIVGFQENKRLPKTPEICSDHFHPDDFFMRANGTRSIKSGALPIGNSVFMESLSNSSDSGASRTPSPVNSLNRSAQAPSSSQTQPENKINTSDDNVIETIEIRTVNENAEDIENNLPAYVLVDNTLNGSTPENDIKIEIEDHELDTNFVPEEPNISRSEPSVEVNSNSQHPIQTFFDSISLTVMKFPPSLAVRAKMEVMKVISDLELELLTQQNSHSKV